MGTLTHPKRRLFVLDTPRLLGYADRCAADIVGHGLNQL